VPELGLNLRRCIGKDYLGDGCSRRHRAAAASSCRCSACSAFWQAASRASKSNVLGLAFGIDPFSPALRLRSSAASAQFASNGSGAPVSITAGPSEDAPSSLTRQRARMMQVIYNSDHYYVVEIPTSTRTSWWTSVARRGTVFQGDGATKFMQFMRMRSQRASIEHGRRFFGNFDVLLDLRVVH